MDFIIVNKASCLMTDNSYSAPMNDQQLEILEDSNTDTPQKKNKPIKKKLLVKQVKTNIWMKRLLAALAVITVLFTSLVIAIFPTEKGSHKTSWFDELEWGNYNVALNMFIDESLEVLSKTSAPDLGLSTDSLLKDFRSSLPQLKKAGFTLTELNVQLGIPPKLIPHFYHKPMKNLHLDETFKALEGNTIGTTLLKLLMQANELQVSMSMPGMQFSEIEIELGPVPAIILKNITDKKILPKQ